MFNYLLAITEYMCVHNFITYVRFVLNESIMLSKSIDF